MNKRRRGTSFSIRISEDAVAGESSGYCDRNIGRSGVAGRQMRSVETRLRRAYLTKMTSSMTRLSLAATIAATFACTPTTPQPAPAVTPTVTSPSMARGIATADSLITASLESSIPGAVFVVAKDGRVLHERAFGYAQLNDYDMRRLAAPRLMKTTTM